MYAAYFRKYIQKQIDEISFEIRLICQPMAHFARLVIVCYHAKDKA